MLQILQKDEGLFSFVKHMQRNERFKSPMLLSDAQYRSNLINALLNPDDLVLGCFDQSGSLTGVFSFYIEPAEKYIECLVSLSQKETDYTEVLSYLSKTYQGYCLDCICNPQNVCLLDTLLISGAKLDAEQLKMRITGHTTYNTDSRAIELTSEFESTYRKLHTKDTYWSAEKVLNASNIFQVYTFIQENKAVGYIDVAFCKTFYELYDWYVIPEYRNHGFGTALLQKVIADRPLKQVELMTEKNNYTALRICEKLGFRAVRGANSITAHLHL